MAGESVLRPTFLFRRFVRYLFLPFGSLVLDLGHWRFGSHDPRDWMSSPG